jgi:hypothetical protein
MKICAKCGEEKEASMFSKNKNAKDGLNHKCKKCCSDYMKGHYSINKERSSQNHKQHYISNREAILLRNKNWEENNKEYTSNYRKEYEKSHKKERKEYQTKRKQNNINIRIIYCLRSRVNKTLRRVSATKNDHLVSLIGCSIADLKLHLENQFVEGMSWENHNLHGWHIDHIIPCIKFDLTNPEEQKKCFHYTNLQPLWAVDNLRKGDRI